MYVAKFAEAIDVLHEFQKKLQQTAGLDLELARLRYASLWRAREED
jgi:phage-related protein